MRYKNNNPSFKLQIRFFLIKIFLNKIYLNTKAMKLDNEKIIL